MQYLSFFSVWCIAELAKIACDVPVEDVELVVGHGWDDLLDGGHGDEVPGRVDEQAAVGVRRAVLYLPHNTNINEYLLPHIILNNIIPVRYMRLEKLI